MNRELFIGAIELSEHIFHIESLPAKPSLNIYTAFKIRLGDISPQKFNDLRLLCVNRDATVYFMALSFRSRLFDINQTDYKLWLQDPFISRMYLEMVFYGSCREHMIRGRFGR